MADFTSTQAQLAAARAAQDAAQLAALQADRPRASRRNRLWIWQLGKAVPAAIKRKTWRRSRPRRSRPLPPQAAARGAL